MKKKGVIVGLSIPGIYPPGRTDVVLDTLAPAFLKSCVRADPDLNSRYDIEIINATIDADQEALAREISEKDPYFVGYSVYVWNYDQMRENSALVREMLPDTKLIVGGPQVSFTVEETLEENPQIDLVICGEGEARFKEILRDDIQQEMFHKVPLVAFRDSGGKIVQTSGDMKDIRKEMTTVSSPFHDGTIDLNDGQKHSVMIETFRGCPMRCSYCQWGDPDGRIQKFQLEQVLKDIDIVYNNPNVEFAYLVDANLFYTPKTHWGPIVERIRDASRRIPTVATLDIRAFNDDMVELFSQIELAFNQFHFGLQSTNPKALDLANRKCSDELWLTRIKRIRELSPQVEISLDMIYGMPGDDYEGFMRTVDFALELDPTRLYMFPLQVLPGTEYWNLKDNPEYSFKLSTKPEYMVYANSTYSETDMRRSYEFSTWFQALQRFYPIRDAVLSLNGNRKVDNVKTYFEHLKQRIDPIRDMPFDFSIHSDNRIRRHFMNTMALPENSKLAYDAALEMMSGNTDTEEINLGAEYYERLTKNSKSSESIEEDFKKLYGADRVDYVQCNWVNSDNLGS
jgi:radical SAM superfamily enzyme YgiQ (UPF0313 family)